MRGAILAPLAGLGVLLASVVALLVVVAVVATLARMGRDREEVRALVAEVEDALRREANGGPSRGV